MILMEKIFLSISFSEQKWEVLNTTATPGLYKNDGRYQFNVMIINHMLMRAVGHISIDTIQYYLSIVRKRTIIVCTDVH